MAFTFWSSSHFKTWIIDPSCDYSIHRLHDVRLLGEENYEKVMIFFSNFIQTLGMDVLQSMGKIRMQVIATAIVYLRRFYSKRSFRDIDPFLLAPTCLYLACKSEEHGILHSSKLVLSANNALRKWPFLNKDIIINMNLIQEAEFYLLEIMDCSLIVFHPYRSLVPIIEDAKEFFKEQKEGCPFKDDKEWDGLVAETTKIINDSYRCDVPLKYAPHQIALGCMLLALINLKKETSFEDYYEAVDTDKEVIGDVVNELCGMYEIWKNFNEKEELKKIFEKIPRPNSNRQPYQSEIHESNSKNQFKF
uniref:Cyclin-C n=1 Tax=Strongyloides venezuelensis TaxID=75913 RepID=A0A0K0F9W9_STRVS